MHDCHCPYISDFMMMLSEINCLRPLQLNEAVKKGLNLKFSILRIFQKMTNEEEASLNKKTKKKYVTYLRRTNHIRE